MSTILKRIPVELKDPDKGLVEAIIATFDVVDKDGDITRKGFFGTQKDVPILWGHDWTMMPLGKGAITETSTTAVFKGGLNLDTEAGRDALAVLKFQGDAQDWSYGFSIKVGGSDWIPSEQRSDFDGADRELHPLTDGSPGSDVAEVSPVVVGAGEDTMTVSVKMADDAPARLADQVGSVAASLEHLATRVADVRSSHKAGHLGARTKDALAKLGAAMMEMGEALAEPTTDPPITGDPPKPEDPPPTDDPPPATVTIDDEIEVTLAEARLRGI